MSLPFDPERSCDRCGRFGAFAFEGCALCGDCYECSGACCPEGREWEIDATTPAANADDAGPGDREPRVPAVRRVSPSA
jgi:hypothetical protein